jgi:hypothetical protein
MRRLRVLRAGQSREAPASVGASAVD